jgi:hypothetical protein
MTQAAQVQDFYERYPYPRPLDSLDEYRRLWQDGVGGEFLLTPQAVSERNHATMRSPNVMIKRRKWRLIVVRRSCIRRIACLSYAARSHDPGDRDLLGIRCNRQ